MLRLLDGATQLKDATAARRCDRDADVGGAKPSYGEEHFLGALEVIMK